MPFFERDHENDEWLVDDTDCQDVMWLPFSSLYTDETNENCRELWVVKWTESANILDNIGGPMQIEPVLQNIYFKTVMATLFGEIKK